MSYILRFRKHDVTFLSDDRIEQFCGIRFFRIERLDNVFNEGERWHFQYKVRYYLDFQQVMHQIFQMYDVQKLEVEFIADFENVQCEEI